MNSVKNFSKLLVIAIGLFGMTTVFSSCAKEKTCMCTLTEGGFSIEGLEVTTKGKCEDVEFAETDDGEDFEGTVECEDK